MLVRCIALCPLFAQLSCLSLLLLYWFNRGPPHSCQPTHFINNECSLNVHNMIQCNWYQRYTQRKLHSALTSRSFKDFPFFVWNDCGSLKIWRSIFEFWIKYHFLSKASFRFDTDGWFCVTTGRISGFFMSFVIRISVSCNLTSSR